MSSFWEFVYTELTLKKRKLKSGAVFDILLE